MKIIIAIIVVIIIAGGVYLATKGDGGGEQYRDTMTESATSTTSATVEGQGTFADLIGRGGDYKCVFSSDDPNASSVGTVYINGVNVRGDFQSTLKANNQVARSHMIQKDGFVYTWIDGMQQGFKLPVTATGGASTATSGNYSMAMGDARGTYDCEPWTVDATQFNVPGSVSFMAAPTTR
jgi:hypothetical protein